MSDEFTDDKFVTLEGFLPGRTVKLKLEAYNLGGSIKMKTALSLIEDCVKTRGLKPGGRIIESSSGNLGVALAILCAQRGFGFTCVLDVNSSSQNIRLIKAYGGRVVVCDKADHSGGYLDSRINIIREMMADDPSLLWTNQYASEANPMAHYRWTCPALMHHSPGVDWLFVGTGTTGTAIGCARYLRDHAPHVRMVAVDAVGSVTFGHPAGPRFIPGLGSSRKPEIFDRSLIENAVRVTEKDAVRMCRKIARRYGILVGGSTGTVLAGLQQCSQLIDIGAEVVAISPDLGERYLDTIYNDEWVNKHIPAGLEIEEAL